MNEYPPSTQNDEIDLFQLIENLWKEKLLIILITFSFVIAGGLYAFLKTPTYQAHVSLAELKPEITSQLKSLRLYPEITTKPLLTEYVGLLNNSSFRQQFIDSADKENKQLYLASSTTNQQKIFSQRFSYTDYSVNKKNTALHPYSATFKAPSPELASSELQRYLDAAEAQLYTTLTKRHTSILNQKREHLIHLIKTARTQAEAHRKDRIVVLETAHELNKLRIHSQLNASKASYRATTKDRIARLNSAILTAEILNIKKPVALSDLNENIKKNVAIELNNSNSPLYLRGTELLNAELQEVSNRSKDYYPSPEIRKLEKELLLLTQNHEIEQLKARKDDSPFNEELKTLKAQLAALEYETFPTITLQFNTSPALAEASPIAPKKLLILALSIIIGCMIGIITALIKISINNRREKIS